MDVIIAKTGELVKRYRETAWHLLVLALVGWSAFNIGLLQTKSGAVPSDIGRPFMESRSSIVSQNPYGEGKGSRDRSDLRVVVSRTSSSKKYHYSWCASAARIKAENRIWFPSEQEAQAAGFTLAGNCSW